MLDTRGLSGAEVRCTGNQENNACNNVGGMLGALNWVEVGDAEGRAACDNRVVGVPFSPSHVLLRLTQLSVLPSSCHAIAGQLETRYEMLHVRHICTLPLLFLHFCPYLSVCPAPFVERRCGRGMTLHTKSMMPLLPASHSLINITSPPAAVELQSNCNWVAIKLPLQDVESGYSCQLIYILRWCRLDQSCLDGPRRPQYGYLHPNHVHHTDTPYGYTIYRTYIIYTQNKEAIIPSAR